MNIWSIVRRSLKQYWRIHLLVALGVAVATTVLTGAFLVGDSVRFSLRSLALDSLQQVDFALVGDRYFGPELVERLQAHPEFRQEFGSAVGICLLPQTTVETFQSETTARASGVTLLGTDHRFWELGGTIRPQQVPAADEIILNATLATELGAKVGDQVLLRLPSADQVPADSPLGRKTDRVRSVTGLRVIEILPSQGLAQFRLRTSQQSVRNAYVAPETLQRAIDEPGKINAILVSSKGQNIAVQPEAATKLSDWLRPTLEDRGIELARVTIGASTPRGDGNPPPSPAPVVDQYQLTTDRLVWDPAVANVVRKTLTPLGVEEFFTYLVNSIAVVPAEGSGEAAREIPYSMVSAVSPNGLERLVPGDLLSANGLVSDHLVLNQWAAEDLQVQPGARIRLVYFEPETTHGQTEETSAEFTVQGILPLTEPESPYQRRRPAQFDTPPTAANDPDLTPTVEGVTDEESIANWDPPFPYDSKRIREVDDEYWQYYRTTPKAFLSLDTGQRLWGSRFGRTTSFRVAVAAIASEDALRQMLENALAAEPGTGFQFTPVKADALRASSGTTPFEGLFLGFSMFLIASALMLVALLFRLGTESRATEAGVLRAVGWNLRQVRDIWLREGLLVAIVGSLAGMLGGVAYAWLMLLGLRTWWVAAIVTPFIELRVNGLAMAVGGMCGLVTCCLVIYFAVRRLGKTTPRDLLAGRLVASSGGTLPKQGKWSGISVGVLIAIAGISAACAITLEGESQAGAFFAGGTAMLAAGIVWIVRYLKYAGYAARSAVRLDLTGLAARAAARNPTRSALTVGLMATACFLIIAISAFRLSPTTEGTGGFNLMATSDKPLFVDLRQTILDELGGGQTPSAEELLVLPMRIHEGDDASCRNLYRPSRPRLLGVSRQAIEDPQLQSLQFRWAASSQQDHENPWQVLFAERTGSAAPVPVVLDKNTAMYSLQLYRGVGEEFDIEFERGQKVTFRVAGLLANSILQGNLIVADQELVRLFPENQGDRFFLVHTAPPFATAVEKLLEQRFGDEGLDVQQSRKVLEDLLSVQNTYLSTFQSLGALGMLLGTFGLAVVQARSVMERRGELALLRAVGFAKGRLGRLVLLENLALLLAGLGTGMLAALVAVIPHMIVGGASVPWVALSAMIGFILFVGILAGWFSVNRATQAPIVGALRGE